jgi:hypothetical protein
MRDMLKVYVGKRIIRVEMMIPFLYKHFCNEGYYFRVNEERNIIHKIERRKGKWVGQVLCRNYFLYQVTEGKIERRIEVRGRRRRRGKQLLRDLKKKR